MARLSALFSAQSVNWGTPKALYAALDAEFHFTLDPCGLGDEGGLFGKRDGLLIPWAGHRVFCNPPYGPQIGAWLERASEPELAVYLLPARTDTRWFHNLVLPAAKEVRFLPGRLKFGDAKNSAPFPNMLAHAPARRMR